MHAEKLLYKDRDNNWGDVSLSQGPWLKFSEKDHHKCGTTGERAQLYFSSRRINWETLIYGYNYGNPNRMHRVKLAFYNKMMESCSDQNAGDDIGDPYDPGMW